MQPACNYLVSSSQHWTVLSSDSIIAGYVVEINTRSLNWVQFDADLMKRDIFKIQYLNPIPLTFSGADRVAQLVERRTNKPKVVGSNQVVVKQLFCFMARNLGQYGWQACALNRVFIIQYGVFYIDFYRKYVKQSIFGCL